MKIKRLLLIHSSHYDDQGKVVRADKIIDRMMIANVVHSALPYLAATLPNDIEMELIEDCFEDVPFDDSADVVAISAQVMQVDRALDIAKEFRARGKKVIMGGYLPTMHPEVVSPHVDALCIGDGDVVFPQMIKDIENNTLKKIYKGDSTIALDNVPTPRYDLIKRDRMVIYPVHATRGCPFKCNYCSIIEFHGHTYRHRPVEHIIRDIKATKSKYVYFTDDNLMEDIEFSKKLFKAMIPLKVTWGTQTTINCSKDPELLDLAYKSGCRFVALGMESISQDTLAGAGKNFNRVDKFEDQIKAIEKSGISVHALIMFGHDSDTPETFDLTLKYLKKLNLSIAEFFTNTPYPSTPYGKKMLTEGRIADTNLAHYREGYVVFKHPTMAPETILSKYWETLRTYYSIKNIIIRFFKANYKNRFYHLVTALVYRAKIRRDIVPVYFGKGNARVN